MQIKGIAASAVAAVERPYLRLELRDELGLCGIGELTPWPAVTLAEVEAMALELVTVLTRLEPFEWDKHAPLGHVSRILVPRQEPFAAMNPARFAAETALLDLLAQRFGRTLADCLSGDGSSAEVPCNALLDASVDDLAAKAQKLAVQGYSAIKVKLRAHDDAGFAREVEALRNMRSVWFGELRLDPNGRWTIDEARRKLEVLAEFSPRYVEQPVPAAGLLDLGKTACPWAADESLLLPGLPERLIDAGTCAAFILKPALLGGLSRAFELAKLAESAEIAVVTTHALDGPVGIATACEFARALPRVSAACGLDLHAGLSRYPNMTSPHHVRPGVIGRTNSLPGLGFSAMDRQRWMA